MRTSILYQNAERDITLIDIPTSIAVAQGADSGILLSAPPLEEPLVLEHEPKSQKTKMKHAEYIFCADKHTEYKINIEKALASIHDHVPTPWCVPRILMTQAPKRGKSDKFDDMEIDDPEKELKLRLREWSALNDSKGEDDAFDLQAMMASLGAIPEANATSTETVPQKKWLLSCSSTSERIKEPRESGSREDLTEPWTASFHNEKNHALDLTISDASQAYCFKIPPRSTLFLSDSTHSDVFRASFRELTAEYTLPRHFDLILLDPPWPSRSAKRKGAYEQVGGSKQIPLFLSVPYMMKMLSKMDVDNYVEHNAMVGIWITNKKSLREHVLGPCGLFEKWNVGLVEEWIWVKTTTKGEPMFSLDSLSRKPYEILLLGRAAPNSWTTMTHAPETKKRVIAAVPDVHSRKPCLKELIEPYMPDPNDYSALEIFPRHLVAGWASWGNEVIKFNWDRYWA